MGKSEERAAEIIKSVLSSTKIDALPPFGLAVQTAFEGIIPKLQNELIARLSEAKVFKDD